MLVSDHLCDRCQFHNLASPFMLSAAFIYLFIQDDFDPYRIVKQRKPVKFAHMRSKDFYWKLLRISML